MDPNGQKKNWVTLFLRARGSEKSIITDVTRYKIFLILCCSFLVAVVQKEAFLRLLHSHVNLLSFFIEKKTKPY